ncbi:endodeoxyribonuclease RUS [uncultured Caudovirales phage]|uniref:Endodeoxyribonuclease RUS n=1 Tax=uncultured Caudovirales phage TaxID=2100421 RepID=A0A6J7WQR5_9CAUD|nr:endodeoxyribonuclease RUS [uncultured Caudovirales phage]
MIKIVLALPPSVNRLWRTTVAGRMYRSPKYVTWKKVAVQNAILQAGRRKINGPYKLTLEVVRPDKKRRDLDNLLKAASDCLVEAGIIDDSECEWIDARWVLSEHPCTITIEEIEHENKELS